jgi:hypothetical protein
MASEEVPEDIGNPAVFAVLTLYRVGSFAYCCIHSEIAYLLSHLMSVLQHLEPAWTRAFLRRTRFLDPDFQGDVLAVISKGTSNSFVCTLVDIRYFNLGMISTALRTGAPLPQITPCPLLDRFIRYHHGLNVMRHEDDDDYGLPRTMSIDVLENEQYMSVLYIVLLQTTLISYRCFCVGVSTSFGIVTRFDRLMHATKELVGEQYHIRGVGYISKVGGVEMSPGTDLVQPIHDA